MGDLENFISGTMIHTHTHLKTLHGVVSGFSSLKCPLILRSPGKCALAQDSFGSLPPPTPTHARCPANPC